MRFAVVNGQRQEAQPRLSGNCSICGRPMVAKCGEIKVWHWAHQVGFNCDPWWENETEWHRAWKALFPDHWQEIVHQSESGEKHIADVKTDRGWVIELQHSYIQPQERRSRDAFYEKLVWVVDGSRRKNDRGLFFNTWKEGQPVGGNSQIRRTSSNSCALLGEWAESHAPIFFDFGEEHLLWWLFAKTKNGSAYIAPFSRDVFIEIHRNGATPLAQDFDAIVKDSSDLVAQYESALQVQATEPFPPHRPRWPRARRRF